VENVILAKFPPVLLLVNQEGISTQVLHCLRLLGIEVHLLAAPAAHFFRWSRYIRSFHRFGAWIELAHRDRLLEIMRAIVRAHGIGFVIAADFEAGRMLASAERDLPIPIFPTSPPAILDAYHNKASFLSLSRRSAVPIADYLVVPDKEDLCHGELRARFGKHYVVKPCGEGNSNGVVYVSNEDALVSEIIENPLYDYKDLLVSPYIPGRDVGLNVFVENGRVRVAVPQTRIGPTIRFIDCEALVEAVQPVMAMGHYTGVANLDARLLRDGTVRVLECNPRFCLFASAVSGANFVEIGLRSVFDGRMPAVPSLVGKQVMPANNALLCRVRGGKGAAISGETRRQLGMTARDPICWIAAELTYHWRKYRQRRAQAALRRDTRVQATLAIAHNLRLRRA